MKEYRVTIKGTTPLLMNKPPAYEQDLNKVKIKNPNINENEEVMKKIYALEGKIYQPATHIRGSLVNAGKDLRIVGKGKATYSKMFASMITIEPELIEHKIQEFDTYTVRTVNKNTSGMNMTTRPRLKEWELDFTMTIEDEVPPEVVIQALERAGRYVGIGDWRPQTKGIHGKFVVTEFKENKRKVKTKIKK